MKLIVDPMHFTVFAIFIAVLFRLWSTIMVLLVPVSKTELMKCCILSVFVNGTDNWSFASGRFIKRFGIWNISRLARVSSVRSDWFTLHFLVCDKNCKICLVRDLKFSKRLPHLCDSFLPIILDWMLSSSFINSFTDSSQWSSSRLILIGKIDSFDSSVSVGVDFIVYRISDVVPLRADSRSFRYLALCILKPHTVQPNSSLDLIKALYS